MGMRYTPINLCEEIDMQVYANEAEQVEDEKGSLNEVSVGHASNSKALAKMSKVALFHCFC